MKIVNNKLKIVEAFLEKVVGIESHSIDFFTFYFVYISFLYNNKNHIFSQP